MLDFCAILVLHSTNYKKQIEKLLRGKVRAGIINEALIQSTITSRFAPVRYGRISALT